MTRIPKKLDEDRVGYLFGEITTDSIAVIYKQIVKLKDGGFTLHICSPGGDATATSALVDLIERTPVNIVTIGTGEVASGGIDILIAGHLRFATPSMLAMIHPHTYDEAVGQHKTLPATIRLMTLEHERRLALYQRRSNLSREKLEQSIFTPLDTWLTAREMLDFGMVDVILSRVSP